MEPLRQKNATSVVRAFEKILDRIGFRPLYFNSDQGTEFVNATFKKLLAKHGIGFFTSKDADIKCAIIERFNRTLMGRIHRYLTKQNSQNYLEALPHIIRNYNNSHHNALGLPPIKVTHQNKEQIWLRLYTDRKINVAKKRKFGLGDHVRIPKTRKAFAKGFRSGWTGEIFKIHRIRPTLPHTYYLEDLLGEKIKGVFYKEELLKCQRPDYFQIESILDKKGDRVLVKWKDYPKKFNQWISRKNLRNI